MGLRRGGLWHVKVKEVKKAAVKEKVNKEVKIQNGNKFWI